MQFFGLNHSCLMVLVYIINFFCDIEAQFRYRNNEEMLEFLEFFSATTSLNTSVFTIGHSVSGKPLTIIEVNQLGDKVGVPNIKFIANIHGNEVLGREILLNFLVFLEKRYPTNVRVKCLLDNARLFIFPSMNPDGFEKAPEGICTGSKGRENANGIDLNRNFPISGGKNSSKVDDKIQPETAAIIDLMNHTTFVLSASIHGGAVVASYPFDTYRNEDEGKVRSESKTPDHDVFLHLAKTYAKYHDTMWEGVHCPSDDSRLSVFPEGITNGAKWYVAEGTMQDYNYIEHGVMELTIEASCCKYPPENKIPHYVTENIEPLVRFGLEALRGVKGLILDSKTNNTVFRALMKINDRDIPFRSSENGEFWRILLPGTYEISVQASGYQPKSQQVIVQNYNEYECPDISTTLIYLTPIEN